MNKKIVILIITLNQLLAFDTNLLWRTSMFGTIVTSYTTNVFDIDEGSIDYGISDNATLFRGNLTWDWHKELVSLHDFDLNLYKQLSYAKWTKLNGLGDETSNNALDFNALYRLENRFALVEYSLGLSLMSNVSLDREIDGGFLYFNHILGIGVKYDSLKLIARFQHYSNNGITHPNINNNFYTLNFGWEY